MLPVPVDVRAADLIVENKGVKAGRPPLNSQMHNHLSTGYTDFEYNFHINRTVFLGGTHPEFPGIAKVINMHHIEFACEHRLSKVDFPCGDFHWKKPWHLDAEPLYMFMNPENWFEEKPAQTLIEVFPEFINMRHNMIYQG